MSLDFLQKKTTENFFLFAGPCVVETEAITMTTAETIKQITEKYKIPFVFKASYKKANRSSLHSFSSIGMEKALKILEKIKKEFQIPIVTDIHTEDEAIIAANIADVLQIPAFLCRQTDLLLAAGKTGKTINIKKGQFLSPESMKFVVEKVESTGNKSILLTERGTMFGYGDLIVDFRSIPIMKKTNYPIIVDITHSLQQPNQASGVTGGNPKLISTIGNAAIAVGANGIFLETHPNPAEAFSDGANMLPLNQLDKLLSRLTQIYNVVKNF